MEFGERDWFRQGGEGRNIYCIHICLIYTIKYDRVVIAGIKIEGWNINSRDIADDITLLTQSKEDLEEPLMKLKINQWEYELMLNIKMLMVISTGMLNELMKW